MGAREILIKPRQLDLGAGTLAAKLITVAINAAETGAASDELFQSGHHLFVGNSVGETILDSGTEKSSQLVSIKTPVALLPRFANLEAVKTANTASELLLHTENSLGTGSTHKAISLITLRGFVLDGSSVGDIGKVKVSVGDSADFLSTKFTNVMSGTIPENPISIAWTNTTSKVTATPSLSFDSASMACTTGVLKITTINGGTI